MATFPDISPLSTNYGARYRRVPLWGPKSLLNLGAPASLSFRKFSRPRWSFEIEWNVLSLTDANSIDAQLRAQHSSRFDFGWFDWYPWWWESVFLGLGDGATVRWGLPSKGTLDATIFSGGATAAGGNDRAFIGSNIVRGVGSDGQDAVDLFAPPPVDRPVWAYLYGRRFFTVTFAGDGVTRPVRDAQTGTYTIATRLIQAKADSFS